ncbi:hypothetical protein C8J55DRAFT_498955 [Lentinula edodes]|uniref:Small ribosomal subunit protein uS11 n=1 Tax=Lentinula lateritia TaxID=40482 RepID=A0A9W9DZD5_9AGAR|nr:hypothetical protein C8J55DRAFT_498955 [Lentinula edodes]
MASKKVKVVKEESTVSLGPQVAEGEFVFGVAHIFASFNDTFVHVTDLSRKETISRVTGGMKVKADRDGSSPDVATLAALDVVTRCREIAINALHSALRALDVTSVPTDSTRRKSARRGRRLGRAYIFYLRLCLRM